MKSKQIIVSVTFFSNYPYLRLLYQLIINEKKLLQQLAIY